MNYSLETSEFTCTHLTFKNNFKPTEANKKLRLKANPPLPQSCTEPGYNDFIFSLFHLTILALSLFKSHCATIMVFSTEFTVFLSTGIDKYHSNTSDK